MNVPPINRVNPAPESATEEIPVVGQLNRLNINPMHIVSTKTPLKLWQETALIILSIALLCIPMAIGLAFSQNYRDMWNRVFSDKKVQPISAPLIKSQAEQAAMDGDENKLSNEELLVQTPSLHTELRTASDSPVVFPSDSIEKADPAEPEQIAIDEEGNKLSDTELLAQMMLLPTELQKSSPEPQGQKNKAKKSVTWDKDITEDAGPQSDPPENEINEVDLARQVAQINQSQAQKRTDALITVIQHIISNIQLPENFTAEVAHATTEEQFGMPDIRKSFITFSRIIDNAPVRAAFLKSPLLTQALIYEYPAQKHALVAEHLAIVFSDNQFTHPQSEVKRKCDFFEVTLEELQNDAKALKYLQGNDHLQSPIPLEKNSPHIAAAVPSAPKNVFQTVQKLFDSREKRAQLGSNSAEIYANVFAQLSAAGVSFNDIIENEASRALFVKSSALIQALFQAFPAQKNAFAAEHIFLNRNEFYKKLFEPVNLVKKTFAILENLQVGYREFFKDPAIVPYFTQSGRLLLILKCIQLLNERQQDASEEQEVQKAGIHLARQAKADFEQGKGGVLTQAGLSRKILQLPEEQQKKLLHKAQLKHHPDKGGDPEVFKIVAQAMEMRKAQALAKYYSLLEKLEGESPK